MDATSATTPTGAGDPHDGPGDGRQLLIGALLRRSAHRWPARVAVIDGEGRWTFGELNERVNRLAAVLRARGVGRGSRVAAFLGSSAPLLETCFAAAKLGAMWVPINARLAPDEVRYQLAHSDSAALVTDVERHRAVADGLSVPLVLTVDGEGPGAGSYEAAIAEAAGDEEPRPGVTDDDCLVVMYTSGTTGRPKGVMLSHKSVYVNTLNWIAAVGVAPTDVYVTGFPLFHIGGVVGVLPFLYLGQPSVIVPTGSFDARVVAATIIAERATVLGFVPTQFAALTDLPEEDLDPALVRRTVWGGSPASMALLQAMATRFPHADNIATFGQTEVTGNATFMPLGRDREKMGTVGLPAPGFEMRIVDEDMRDVPQGAVGELVYRGPQVMLGYLDDPEATRAAFTWGWLHSGDLVVADEDGYLSVVDRKKDMIISGGENISSAEVENVLAEHPSVAETAVIGVPDPRWGEVPKALVVVRPGTMVTAAELVDFCAQHLARFKRPRSVAFVPSLPRNAVGKLLKRELRARHEAPEHRA
jgi:fatty-acyl-CoA synthase